MFEIAIQGRIPGFPIGGARGPILGGMHLQHGCFSVKIKELGPVAGRRAPENFVCRSANAFFFTNLDNFTLIKPIVPGVKYFTKV